MPPPAERRKRPQDGISRVQKVAAVEIGFMVLSDVFRVYEYIWAKEVGRWSHEGPTRVGAARGAGAPPCLVASSLIS